MSYESYKMRRKEEEQANGKTTTTATEQRSAANSPLIQSFWLGKSILRAQRNNKTCDYQESTKHLNELLHDMNVLKTTCFHETCLSPNVHRMVCRLGSPQLKVNNDGERQENALLLSVSGSIDWHVIAGLLKQDITDASFSYERASDSLFDISQSVHQTLLFDVDEFEQKYSNKLCWTGKRETFLEFFSMICHGDSLMTQISMLLMSSLLERALGDLYLTLTEKGQCPTSLKDLLGTVELHDQFGTVAITCLNVLMGPPCGLNLRNILWHGFAAPGEIAVEYALFLLVLVCSLSDALTHPLDSVMCITRRRHAAFHHLDLITSAFPVLSQDDIAAIKGLFGNSFFIIPTMLPVWEKALDFYLLSRFDYTIVLLLPQLEQGLRRVFACVNNCPERVLTAESTVLYTTFDQILSPILDDGITQNVLRQEVGDAHVELLLDLLVHVEGPRLRDRISHGEVELSCLSKELASHVICVCAVFSFLYLLFPLEGHQDGTKIVHKIMTGADNYKSVFHPISILKRKTKDLKESLSMWGDFPKPDNDEFAELDVVDQPDSSSVAEQVYQTINDILFQHKNCHTSPAKCRHDVFETASSLLEMEFTTLYCTKFQLELVGVLRNIIHCCDTVAHQISNTCHTRFKQWSRKELRSRQRSNYGRLWSHMPIMESVLNLMLVVVINEITQLPSAKVRTQEQSTKRLKFLRQCLTCTENLKSLSGPKKNRWDECSAIGKTLIRITTETFKNI